MDLPDLSSAAPLLTPIWNAVVDTWLKPALTKMKQQKRLDVSFDEHGFANAFSDYLERSYNKHSFITTVVF